MDGLENIIVNVVDYPSEDDWIRVRNNALFTQRKSSNKPVPEKLKLKFLASEHSPIYTLQYTVELFNIPYWVSNQLVRAHVGFVPFVSSQRNDIQKEYNRKKAPQDAPVNLRFEANAQAIVNISHKRECLTASSETRMIWAMVLEAIREVSPEIIEFAVKPCVYRNGICPEVFSNCRYNTSEKFKKELEEYTKFFKMPQ